MDLTPHNLCHPLDILAMDVTRILPSWVALAQSAMTQTILNSSLTSNSSSTPPTLVVKEVQVVQEAQEVEACLLVWVLEECLLTELTLLLAFTNNGSRVLDQSVNRRQHRVTYPWL